MPVSRRLLALAVLALSLGGATCETPWGPPGASAPPGEPVDEIATRRPFDDPGATFFYRLRPIDETIVHKTHIVYRLGPARLSRLRQLFLDASWEPTAFPGWAPEVASKDADLAALVSRFGVRRTDPRFSTTADWLHEDLRRESATEFGLYDLGRTGNL